VQPAGGDGAGRVAGGSVGTVKKFNVKRFKVINVAVVKFSRVLKGTHSRSLFLKVRESNPDALLPKNLDRLDSVTSLACKRSEMSSETEQHIQLPNKHKH
jgi:hypothetical protein